MAMSASPIAAAEAAGMVNMRATVKGLNNGRQLVLRAPGGSSASVWRRQDGNLGLLHQGNLDGSALNIEMSWSSGTVVSPFRWCFQARADTKQAGGSPSAP